MPDNNVVATNNDWEVLPPDGVGHTPFRAFSATEAVANIVARARAAGQPNTTAERMREQLFAEEMARRMEGGLEEPIRTRDLPIDVMKKRHLNSNERSLFHKPKRDWVVTETGKEICRSASVLDVSDLVAQLI